MKPREEVRERESRQICGMSRTENTSLFSSLFTESTLSDVFEFQVPIRIGRYDDIYDRNVSTGKHLAILFLT